MTGYTRSGGDMTAAFKMGLAAGSASAFSDQLATEADVKKVFDTIPEIQTFS